MYDRIAKTDKPLLPFQKNRIGSVGSSEIVIILHLIQRRWVFLLVLAIAASSAAIWEHNHFPLYHAKTTIYFQSADTNPLQALTAKLSGESTSTTTNNDFPEKYLQLLMSYPFALEAAKNLNDSPDFKDVHKDIFFRRQNILDWFSDYVFMRVQSSTPKNFNLDDIAEGIQYWVSYNRSEAGGVNISVNTPEPKLSLLLANLISKTAVASITNQNLKELNEAEKYLNEELTSTEKKLEDAELSIVDYKKTNKLITIDEGVNSALGRMEATKQELMETNFEIDQTTSLLQKSSSDLESQMKKYIPKGDGASSFGLTRRVQDLKDKLQYLKTRQLSLKRSLSSMVNSQDPHSEQKIYDLKKRMELEYSHFQDLEHQSFQVELQRIAAVNKISISAPVRESNIIRTVSLTKKLIMSLLFSFVLGVALSRLQELISPVVRSREDFESLGIAFLAAIPNLNQGPFWKRKPKKLSSQTFKHICTRLMHFSSSCERGLQVVSVMSPVLNDGKSFISKNLAASFAQMGKRTLIIDMGASSRHGGFGLTDILRGTEKFAKVCIQNITPGLDLLPGGALKDDLSILLNGQAMSQLMEDIRSIYSYIVIDTLSLSVSVDSALLSEFSDATVIVAVTNQTSLQDVERLTELMGDSMQKPVLGVLNRFPGAKSSLFKAVHSENHTLSIVPAERST